MSDDPRRMYHIVHQATVDPELGEALQTAYNLDDGATREEMEARALLCHQVVWRMVRENNHRKYQRVLALKRERERARARAAQGKLKVSQADLLKDEMDLQTAVVKLEADVRADAELAGEDADHLLARLRAEALTNGEAEGG